jgi:hypothetical protein
MYYQVIDSYTIFSLDYGSIYGINIYNMLFDIPLVCTQFQF